MLEFNETKCNTHFMNETSIDWDNWQLFMAVAREGGLASAAKVTGKSAPTLGRRMQVLERLTGKELFLRLPRGYELTESGKEVFERIARIEASLSSLDGSDQSAEKPLIKVSAGSWMTFALCQKISVITKNSGMARIRFISVEAVLDISRRETTIGIRNNRPSQPNLVCRKLGRVHFAGYATSKNSSNWIQVHTNTPSAFWVKEQMKTQESQSRSNSNESAVLEATSPRNALDIANAGVGRVVLPTFIGDNMKRLKRVTPKISELSHDQWLVTHPDEQYHVPVRRVIDGIYRAAKDLHRA